MTLPTERPGNQSAVPDDPYRARRLQGLHVPPLPGPERDRVLALVARRDAAQRALTDDRAARAATRQEQHRQRVAGRDAARAVRNAELGRH